MSLRNPSRRVTKRSRGIAQFFSEQIKRSTRLNFWITATKSQIFALILLPRAITLGPNLAPVEAIANAQFQPVESVSVDTTLKFDASNPSMPLKFEVSAPEIQKTNSRIENERKANSRIASFSIEKTLVEAQPEPDFMQKRALVQEIAVRHGIDWRLLEAVWQIESGKRWKTNIKSYAGAQGPMQFLPSTWRRYATEEYSDINYAPHALNGGAKLLAANGAVSGNIDKALFAYNHANWYVEKVKKIMEDI